MGISPCHVRVLRLEHTYCPSAEWEVPRYGEIGFNHGPMSSCWKAPGPSFGGAGNGPETIVEGKEVCGVTIDQFKIWWSYSYDALDLVEFTENGWRFIEFLMPRDKIRIDNEQVVFVRDLTYKVAEHPIEAFGSTKLMPYQHTHASYRYGRNKTLALA